MSQNEQHTVKVVTMMTPSMVKAIEGVRVSRGEKATAEVVRQLVSLGLRAVASQEATRKEAQDG